jgi:methionyl-tRNA formyltransferase
LTAVFFLHLSATTAPMVRAWLDSGHRIGAVVLYRQNRPGFFAAPRQWLALHGLRIGSLRRHGIQLIEENASIDWGRLRLQLEAVRPDVAITYGFMRLVPQEVLSLFPLGALNLHPALLPYYRGPAPFHWLAIDNEWQRHGGVTLHEMTDAFDEGPVIAQAAMSDSGMPDDLRGFVADALVRMTRDVIPRYCAGELRAWPQQPGAFPYAHVDLPRPAVQPHWTRKQLRSLCSIIRRRPGVVIDTVGGPVRLLAEAYRIGPASGEPPVLRWSTIEFDLADGRVAYRRHTPLNKFLGHFTELPRFMKRRSRDMPIRFGPFDRQDPARREF